MKKIYSLLMMLIVAISTSWAGTTPDYESYDWDSAEAMATGLAGDDAVIITDGSTSTGNVSGHYYAALGGNLKNSDATWTGYLGISSAQQIEKIEIFYCPNGTKKTNLAWVAWGEGVDPNQYTLAHGTTTGTTGSKSWDAAVWETIDLSGTEAYTVYISRSVREFREIGATSNLPNFGEGNTINVLGLKVYLASGTTHTVTYDLGAATSGTVPTQDAVGEGSKFTVADAPSDLVAPEGKDFKCWNDGTDDYAEGDKYTMGTSDVTLTAVYADKYAVSYAAGDGTGTMDGEEVAEGKKITLPASTFTAPVGKAFKNWLCSIDGNTYDAGAPYTMTAEATTFTAQYASLKVVYSLIDGIGSAEVTADDATVNEGESLVLTNTSGRIKITAAEGQTFKAGDFITFTARIGNGTKKCGIKYGATTSLGTDLYVDGDGNNPSTSDYVVSGTLSLSADASDIYIGRYDGTTTTLTSLVISRFVDVVTITPAKQYTTFSSTKALNFSAVEGLEAYAAAYAADGKVVMTKVTDIPANTGLVLKKTGSAGSYDVPEGTATSLGVDNKLVAATTDTAVEAYDADNNVFNYILKDGEFHPATAGTLAAGKAYLSLDASAGQQGLVMEFDDAPTAVEAVAEAKVNVNVPVKVIKNGQLFIGNYNVAGARVK